MATQNTPLDHPPPDWLDHVSRSIRRRMADPTDEDLHARCWAHAWAKWARCDPAKRDLFPPAYWAKLAYRNCASTPTRFIDGVNLAQTEYRGAKFRVSVPSLRRSGEPSVRPPCRLAHAREIARIALSLADGDDVRELLLLLADGHTWEEAGAKLDPPRGSWWIARQLEEIRQRIQDHLWHLPPRPLHGGVFTPPHQESDCEQG